MSLEVFSDYLRELSLTPAELGLLAIVVPLTIGVIIGYGRGALLGVAAAVIGLALVS